MTDSSRPSFALPWHRRLETRVALALALAVGAALAGVLVASARIVRTNALSRAQEDLQAARAAFYRLVDNRAEFAAENLRMVTELPVFRAYMTPQMLSDQATIYAMTDENRQSMKASFAVLANAAGMWVSSPGWPARAGAPPQKMTDSIARGLKGQPNRDIIAVDNRLYLIVTQPATFVDEVLATVTAGFPLDDGVARELALTTRCDITLISERSISGTSLPPRQHQALVDALAANPDAIGQLGQEAELRTLGNAEYVGGAYTLASNATQGSPGTLVLLQDWQPTQQFVDEIRSGALAVGGVVFVLALAGGIVMSRSITRPLSQMAAVADDVAAGEWDRRVPVTGADEVASLAGSFNHMTVALSHLRTQTELKTVQLQDAYDRFHAVTESANDAIISADDQGIIRFWNRAAGRIFGYDEGEIVGQRYEILLHEDSRAAHREDAARLRAQPGVLSQGMVDATGLRKNGDTFPLELSLATWTSSDRINVTAIVRDITERRRAEEALRRSETELRQSQKMEAVGRLAGGVAHDFNNLLTAIRGYAELLTDDLEEGDPRRTDALEILKASDSAGALTRQLLAFSRRQILAPRIVSVDAIVRGMERMVQRLIGEDIAFSVQGDGNLWSVKADPGQIEQVVLNLVVNARDAMPTGGHLTVSVANTTVPEGTTSGRRPGEYVTMTVTDTGSGMDEETLAHIFEPFFTTKEEGHGTGLGLATVDGIVEQSGGFITVESDRGRGTSFHVTFPRAEEAAYVVTDGPAAAQATGAHETVLLVEDEDAVRGLARQSLTRQGYQVIEAANGDEALIRATNHSGPIHILVTDVVMPGISGRVLWERLTVLRSETKVLFVSGYTDDAVVRHGIRELGLPYLQKPFTLGGLADAVRRALDSQLK